MKSPFISICIPVYNMAPYLRECLDSIVNKSFGDWEAVCTDDWSTDESGAILDEYAQKDSRIKVIHQKNGGLCNARNAALDRLLSAVLPDVYAEMADLRLSRGFRFYCVREWRSKGTDRTWRFLCFAIYRRLVAFIARRRNG